MDSPSSSGGPSAYLESLMQAGQQATRQFDDALAAAMGVEGKPAKGEDMSPFALAANLHRQFWWPAIDFWRGFFTGKPDGRRSLVGKSAARRPALQGRGLEPFAVLRAAQAILSAGLEAIDRTRRSGAGRRQGETPAPILCAAIHRCDEPVELPCDKSGSHPQRDPDPLEESRGRHAKPDRGFAEGPHHAGGRVRLRDRPQSRLDPRNGRVRERADPAHSIYAADAGGGENAACDRAALHQQVLSARSRRGQLVRRICRCPRPSGVPDLVAQRGHRDAISDLGRLSEPRAAEGDRRRARDRRRRPRPCAGILCRRHHHELRRRRAGRARRRQACDADPADHDDRFHRHRRDRPAHRRAVGGAARGDDREAAASCPARSWPSPSAPCGPTI